MISLWDLIIIVIVLGVVLFGANKIPELFRNLGRAVGEYRKAQIEAEKELKKMEEELKKQQEKK